MNTILLLAPLLLQVLTSGHHLPGSVPPIGPVKQPNVLLILVDDLGVEHVDFHPVGRAAGNPAPTPYLDSLASQAVIYTQFYATPICSASRASRLTGRYPFRHGVGGKIAVGEHTLPRKEVTIAEQVRQVGYRTGAFGKWHVSYDRENPRDQGFEHYDGCILNLGAGGGDGYYDWLRVCDGQAWMESRYATSATTDAAKAWIQERNAAPDPWFAYVAYHAPHSPHDPPPAYLNPITQASAGDSNLVIYHGMIEALDREIERLMRVVDLTDTLVIFVGDNGSPNGVVQGPVLPGKAKHTAFEGGILVPAFVTGAGVNQDHGDYEGPVHIVDLFDTILDYTGAPHVPAKVAKVDSVSLYDRTLPVDVRWIPLRQTMFTERFGPNGTGPLGPYTFLWRAARDGRYKVLRTLGGDRLFDLQVDPWEKVNLLKVPLSPAMNKEYQALTAVIDDLTWGKGKVYGN